MASVSSAGLTLRQALVLKPLVLLGRSRGHEPRRCGGCGGVWTWSSGESHRPGPQPGAFCICHFCGVICQYRADLSGAVLSKKEFRSLPRAFRRQLLELQGALRASIAARKARTS